MIGLDRVLEWIGNASLQLLVAAAIAWLLCMTIARKSAALRHAIWVVVLLKCFVPPSVTAPWSLAQLWTTPTAVHAPADVADSAESIAAAPLQTAVKPDVFQPPAETVSPPVGQASPDAATSDSLPVVSNPVSQPINAQPLAESVEPVRQARLDLRDPSSRDITAAEAFKRWWMGTLSMASLLFVWISGAILALAFAAVGIVRVATKVRRGEQIDEGPAAVAIEEAALRLGLKSTPRLVATVDAVTPFVAGLFRPTVVIPRSILRSLPTDELRLVVWHEVVHVARRDAWTSLLQLFSVATFWFHPAVWWAASAVRREREACCDETVLRTTQAEPSTYGDAFLHVLSAVRGRAIAAPAWAAPAGVFERDSDLRSRIEQIMSFRPTSSKRITVGLVATLFALAVVPMGVRASDPWVGIEEADIPTIVSISPSIGATDVDPEIGEIKVTFDRPMSGGFSWTGSGPTYPPMPGDAQPSWSDDRKTCTLPVALKEGQFYRVGINSKSFKNFRSAEGVPVKPSVLTFTTAGANKAAIGRMEAPKIVAIDPPNGATDVHPLTTKEIRVTFDRPMGGGMSWVGGGEIFPSSPDGAKPRWLSNSRTCVFPVDLESNRAYELRLNSDRHTNFQSSSGVPLKPVRYKFATTSESDADLVFSDGFEWPHRDKSFVEFWGHVRTSADAASGSHSLKLHTLDPPIKFPLTDNPDDGVALVQDGKSYGWGEPFAIPDWATKLQISAMIKAEQVDAASIKLGFMKLTPSARAGKEKSYFTVAPVGADPADDDVVESLFFGRLSEDEPAADHGWALYERTIAVPEHAELINVLIELEDGDALWVDDLKITAAAHAASADSGHRAVFVEQFDEGVLDRWTPSLPRDRSYHSVSWATSPQGSTPVGNRFIVIHRGQTRDSRFEDISHWRSDVSEWPGLRSKPVAIPQGAERLKVVANIRKERSAEGQVRVAFVIGDSGGGSREYQSVTPIRVAASDLAEPGDEWHWQPYEGIVDVPENARGHFEIDVSLLDGDGIAIDWLRVEDVTDELRDAAAVSSLRQEPKPAIASTSASEPEDPKRDARPPSTNPVDAGGDEGLLFADHFDDGFNWQEGVPRLWKASNAPGVVLRRRDDIGRPGRARPASLELRKSVDSYFPIASWSRRLDHKDSTATYVQLTANVKAENARKAVLDVLFLDESGEWIRHQWADHIGDYRNEWLAGEGRLAEGTDTTPETNGVTHDWQPYGGVVAIPGGTKFIEVSAQIYGPGTVFVDNVEVRYVTHEP